MTTKNLKKLIITAKPSHSLADKDTGTPGEMQAPKKATKSENNTANTPQLSAPTETPNGQIQEQQGQTQGQEGQQGKEEGQQGEEGKQHDTENQENESKSNKASEQKNQDKKGKKPDRSQDQEKEEQIQKKEMEKQAGDTYPPIIIESILASIRNNQPILLIGETGTGKTTVVKCAAQVFKKPLHRVNITGQTGREDLVGKFVLRNNATEWEDGLLLRAMKRGEWILLDEINAALPDVLLTIQAVSERTQGKLGDLVLTEKHGEVITPHPDFRLFATCNPPTYMGLKDFNTATLSRFMAVHVGMMSVEQTQKHFGAKYPSLLQDENTLPNLWLAIHALQKEYIQGDIAYCASMRDLDTIGHLYESGVSLPTAIYTGIVAKVFDETEREQAAAIVNKFTVEFPKQIEELEQMTTRLGEMEKVLKERMKHLSANTLLTDMEADKIQQFVNSWRELRRERKEAEANVTRTT